MSLDQSPTVRATSTARRRGAVLAGATAAALAVWGVAGPVAGIEVTARVGGAVQPVGPVAVAGAALLAGLAGWALLALLERGTARARQVWTVTAVVVLAASLAGPVGSATGGSAAALAAMHLATGAVLIALLPGWQLSRSTDGAGPAGGSDRWRGAAS